MEISREEHRQMLEARTRRDMITLTFAGRTKVAG
jgi:hypothetical protein